MTNIDDEKRYKCLCDTHVRKGALIVAVISIVFAVFEMVSAWILMNYYSVFPQIVGIVTSILIIVGNRAEKAWMYIPYLVLTACGILASILVSIYLLVIAIVLPDYELEKYEEWPESGNGNWKRFHCATLLYPITLVVRAVFITMFVITFISVFIYTYFWYVIFKAYKYMRDEIEAEKFGVKTVVYSLPTQEYVNNQQIYGQQQSNYVQPPI